MAIRGGSCFSVAEYGDGLRRIFDRTDHRLSAGHRPADGIASFSDLNQNISFNTIQPYPEGDLEGLYPTILNRKN